MNHEKTVRARDAEASPAYLRVYERGELACLEEPVSK